MRLRLLNLSLIIVVMLAVMLPGTTGVLAQTAPAKAQAEVIAAALNVREGPGINYTIQKVAKAGDVFEIVGTNSNRSWVQVVMADGSKGWISALPAYTKASGSLDNVAVIQAAPSAAGVAASISSGGKLVLMTSSGGDIYTINADGSGLRLLTRSGLDPALSPDGQQVAFTRWGPTEGVYLINIDGSNERQVHAGPQPKSPTWSPDGTQLIFNLQRGGRLDVTRECQFSSEDSSDDAGLPPDAYDISKDTIPENKKNQRYEYCYSLPAKPAWQLRKLDLATGQYQDLSSDYSSFGPAWDPRNPWRVVYSGDVSLVQLDVNQDTRTSLIEGNLDRTPAFSPDGTRLAVAHKGVNDQWVIEVINLDTGERLQLANTGNNVSPAWSPDGSQLAFLSNRSGQWEIWVMNADGSNQRPMFAPGTLTGISLQYNFVDERMISWSK
ncbi:MAG: PD40 domain-containing protein [Anaerolineae bacterium]|nr:PD40 domain-containing protein [Anaerolineae bacterium]